MAAPVVTVSPPVASLNPGDQLDVLVEATDPDSLTGSVVFPVSDGQGNTVNASIDLTVEDPLTFGDAENPDGLSVTIQKIASGPTTATYRITAA